jgi:peptidyl-tRNA hydrolase, PTH1 family
MKLIVGLGNPGKEYEKTRHNVGFRLIDYLATKWDITTGRRRFESRYGQGNVHGQSAAMMKPQTYMNLSGVSVAAAIAFYQTPIEDLLVVLDDMALETGQIRLRSRGTAGGHNGLQNIIERLGRNDFARLRIGIGSAGSGEAVRYVLDDFDDTEQKIIDAAIRQAADAVECWMTDGIEKAMNRFNTKNTES